MKDILKSAIFKIVAIITTLLTTHSIFAVVVELKSLDQIAPLIDKNTIVIFDIDNTLITSNQSLGSAEWYYHVFLSNLKDGMTEADAHLKAQDDWYKIALKSDMELVEKNTANFVRNLQKSGVKVMGLTARPTNIYKLTKKQLSEKKIDLAKNTFSKKSDVEIAKNIRYTHGILFVNEQNKGEALIKFFEYFNVSPKKVVFVDDVQKNVDDMEAALSDVKIDNVNVRYSATDAKVNSFDPKVTDLEWSIFQKDDKLISDSEAKKLLLEKPATASHQLTN